jgi:DNA-directed RNA polymerase subunit RPC12/RpoP
MVKCNNCGAEVVGSDFCFNCGEKVEKFETNSDICPKCGTKNKKDTNFCVECGHRLANGASVSFRQQEWNARRDEVLARYDKLAEEFGIKDEDYFLTSVRRFNKLEQGTSKHRTVNALFTDVYAVTSGGIPFMNLFVNVANKLFSYALPLGYYSIAKFVEDVQAIMSDMDISEILSDVKRAYVDKFI